jgi:hypothetical protein
MTTFAALYSILVLIIHPPLVIELGSSSRDRKSAV